MPGVHNVLCSGERAILCAILIYMGVVSLWQVCTRVQY